MTIFSFRRVATVTATCYLDVTGCDDAFPAAAAACG